MNTIKLWTAVIVLIGTIVTTGAVIINNFAPIKKALEPKPLEGIWDSTNNYSRFHGEEGVWSGDGRALIIWRQSQQQYEIYHGNSIFKSGESAPALSGFWRGIIKADDDGWPASQGFAIEELRYISRLSCDGQPQSTPKLEFTNCHLTKKGNRADVITGDFVTPLSRATIELKWYSSLQ